MERVISVLGATGSVGTQALDVARARNYRVDFMTAGSNYKLLESLAREFRPRTVALESESAAQRLRESLRDTDIKVLYGMTGIEEGIFSSESEVAVNAILGKAGLMPSLAVIDSGKRLALANKESLVVAGELVMARAKDKGVEIVPVDSEHCAIHQSMRSGAHSEVRRIILTASGGPFFGMSAEQIKSVTLSDTLSHPTWKMGKKITVDSATLMNKGFELIEAMHLFGVKEENIEIVVHRESILHSAVEYVDKSIIGEFSVPDMRSCVQYAVDYPKREPSVCEPLDLTKIGALHFAKPDEEAFPLLSLARECARKKGALSAVMNAADEVAVEAFLKEKIPFSRIAYTVIEVTERLKEASIYNGLDAILNYDTVARAVAREIISG